MSGKPFSKPTEATKPPAPKTGTGPGMKPANKPATPPPAAKPAPAPNKPKSGK